MANHPSRGWRSRMFLAASIHADQLLTGRSDGVLMVSCAEVRQIIVQSFRAGFEAGRLDVRKPRHTEKENHVHFD